MKRLAMVLLALSSASATFGASGTWVGKVSDARCGPNHEKGPPTRGQTRLVLSHWSVLNDAECAALCVAAGSKHVLVTDDGVYAIANQKIKGLESNLGQMVQIDGSLEGTTITVTKIASAPKKAKKN
jgi:hypothetical protein